MSAYFTSIQTEIDRIKNAKTAIASAITEKGVSVPSGTSIDGMASLIANIPTGGGTVVDPEPAEDDIPKVFFGEALPQTKTDVVMPFRYISKTMDISGYCETKAQGNSSMSHPKKNQTVKLFTDENCTEKMKVNFKGWGKQNKFCFKANWIDLTHARNVVSARLWGDMVRSRANFDELPELLKTSPNVGAVDGFPVKVYADGVYQGRYTLNIPKDKWMANMDDDLDTHCILCGESNADNRSLFRAAATIDGTDWSDEIHDTVPVTIKTRWNEVISFVMNSTDDEFVNGIGNYFDVPSLIDYYLFGLLTCGLDAFGKNQLYMTYDGQKWYPTMYDMDSTWGLWWNGASFVSSDYAPEEYQDFKDGSGNLLYIRLTNCFADEINNRWKVLRDGVFSFAHIVNRFERFTDIAEPWLVSEDYASTTANGAFTAIPNKNNNNIQQIRAFIVNRLVWCDEYIGSQAPVWEEYTAVSFVQSDGRQYIDTQISGGVNAEYEILCQFPREKAVNYEQYFGGAKSTSVAKLYLHSDGNVVAQSVDYTSQKGLLWKTTSTTGYCRPYTVHYAKDGTITLNGSVIGDTAGMVDGAGWGDLSWYVFANHEEGLMSIMRVYGLKMWTDGVLVRDFVPVVRNSDGVAGLLDLIEHSFFPSLTNSPLIAFTGEEAEYRPSAALPSGYQEVVIDETSSVSIPNFGNNPSGTNGNTHFEMVVQSLDVIFSDVFYLSMDINNASLINSTAVYNTKTYAGTNYLCISLPTNIVGKTLDEVKAWLSEHNIVFYVKTA